MKPNSRPVRMALPSQMVRRGDLRIKVDMAHSKHTQKSTELSKTTTAPNPKNHREASNAGTRAMHTPYMLRETLSPPCTCGESDIIGFIFVYW